MYTPGVPGFLINTIPLFIPKNKKIPMPGSILVLQRDLKNYKVIFYGEKTKFNFVNLETDSAPIQSVDFRIRKHGTFNHAVLRKWLQRYTMTMDFTEGCRGG